MKKNSLGDYLLYYLVRVLAFLFKVIPVSLALFIARRLGVLSMYFSPKRRRIAYANLKAAFGAKYTTGQLKKILRRTYANIGQGLIEVLLLPKMDKAYVERYISYEDFHLADEALKRGKGLIFLTAHFGNWEVGNIACAIRGFPFKAIAREQKPYLLNQLLNRYRESKGCRMIPKGLAIKEILKSLRSNGIAAMLVDQDAGKTGVFVKLFGREASWNRGVMEFAIKTGASIIPGFAIREKGPYIRFKLFKPIELPQHGSKEDIIKEGFEAYVSDLESLITEYPDQWLWQHRRWKSTPIRDVLILNDTRTGHLRQSEAVARSLSDIWQKRGYRAQDIRVKIIDVEFKKDFYRELLALSSNFSHPCCQGCMGCLRFCLKATSYNTLLASYADIIISCGSSTAAVNLFLSKENNAKSVVIMKPALINLKKFDFAIIPRHDNPADLKNVIITGGALNLINRQTLRDNGQKLHKMVGSLKDKVVGILIGGPTKDFDMDETLIRTLLENVIRACCEYDCDILLTTSRRTPKEIENLIKERLGNESRCRLLIIANEKNIDGAIEGILGLSDITLVSQESISMISEAASSSTYTIVFRQKGYQDRRHEAFLKNLSQGNFIEAVEAEGVYSAISDVFRNHLQQRILDDSSKIEDTLARLL